MSPSLYSRTLNILHDPVRQASSMFLSRDKRLLEIGYVDGVIRLLDLTTWTVRTLPHYNKDNILMGGFSADGRLLVTSSMDGTARLWEVESGTLLKTFFSFTSVTCSDFSPDGKHVLTGSFSPFFCIDFLDIETGENLGCYEKVKGLIAGFEFPEKDKVIVCAVDRSVSILSIPTGKLLRKLGGIKGNIMSARMTEDKKYLLVGAEDKMVRVWNLQDEKEPVRILSGCEDTVTALAISSDGQTLATGDAKGSLVLWNYVTGEPVHRVAAQSDMIINLEFSSDGRRVLSCGAGGTFLWDSRSGEQLAAMKTNSPVIYAWFLKNENQIVSLAIEEGVLVQEVSETPFDASVQPVLLETPKPVVPQMTEEEEPNPITEMVAQMGKVITGLDALRSVDSPHHSFVLETCYDNTADSSSKKSKKNNQTEKITRLVEKETGNTLHEFDDSYDYNSFEFIGPAGRFLCKRQAGPYGVEVWDAVTVKCLSVLDFHVAAFDVDSSGEKILCGTEAGTVSIYRTYTGELDKTIIGEKDAPGSKEKTHHSIRLVRFHPDGRQCLVYNSDGILSLWDIETGERCYISSRIDIYGDTKVKFLPNGNIKLKNNFNSVIINPNKEDVSTAPVESAENVTVEKAGTLSPFRVVNAIRGLVLNLAVSPDGKYAATSSESSNDIRLYDIHRRELLKIIPVRGVEDRNVSLRQFAPDGQSLYEIDHYTVRQIPLQDGIQPPVPRALPKSEKDSYDPVDWIKGSAISPDGTHVFVCGEGRKGILLDTSEGTPIKTIVFKNKRYELYSPVFSPDGKYIAVTDTACTIHVFDLDGTVLYEETMSKWDPQPVCWTADSRFLLIGRKKELLVLDLTTGQMVETFSVKRGTIVAASFSSDQKRLAVLNQDRDSNQTIVYDYASKEILYDNTFKDGCSPCDQPCLFADGDSVLLRGTTGLQFIETQTFQTLCTIEDHPGRIADVVLLEDEKTLLLNDNTVARIIDLESGNETGRIENFIGVGMYTWQLENGSKLIVNPTDDVTIYDVAKQVKITQVSSYGCNGGTVVSPDLTRLAAGKGEKRTVYELPSGKKLFDFTGIQEHSSESIVFSPDSKRLLVSDWNPGIQLFDATTGKLLHQRSLDEKRYYMPDVLFTGDGNLFFLSGTHSIELFDTETFEPLKKFSMSSQDKMDLFHGSQFLPSAVGEHLCLLHDRRISLKVFDWSEGKTVREFTFGVTDLANATPDVKHNRVYFGTVKGEIKVLSLLDWTWSETVAADAQGTIEISPDGMRLAVVHQKGIELFETDSWRHLGGIPARDNFLNMPEFIRFSPHWHWLAMAPSHCGLNSDELQVFRLEEL